MMSCRPRTDEMVFVLSQVLQGPHHLQALSPYRKLDIAKYHPETSRREAAQRWCSLTTPWCTGLRRIF